MKRLKLKHDYHDACITAIRYSDDADVVIDVDLCGGCNRSPGAATLRLVGVRNFAHVQTALEGARQRNASRGYIDEIIGIVRDERRGFLLDLMTAGAVYADAQALHEA